MSASRGSFVSCTGLSASWCPIHGDCCCVCREDSMSDEACPLHSPWSTHGDVQVIETAWGPVEIGDDE